MKRTILFAVLLSLLTVSVSAQKAKAPERQGWSNWSDDSLYGNVESITITKYILTDKFGEIIKDGTIDKKVYKFNQQGDVIEEAYYYGDGSLWWKDLYKYDSKGNIIEKATYNSDGSLWWKDLYKYDSQGNKIESAYYNSDGSLNYKHLYKYDSQGNKIEVAEDGFIHSPLCQKTKYKYDSKGNKIETARYFSNGSLDYKYLYKYDSKGNEIKKARYDGEIMKPTSMIVREIVYR